MKILHNYEQTLKYIPQCIPNGFIIKKKSIISIHIYKNKNHSLTIVSGVWEYISVF